MPRPYVSRLVFDRKHESLALLKIDAEGDYAVMRGCCDRSFMGRNLTKLDFWMFLKLNMYVEMAR